MEEEYVNVVNINLQAEDWNRSRVIQLKKCCCLIPLGCAVKILAFVELTICSSFFLYTLGEIISQSSANQGTFTTQGDLLYLHYTALVDVIFAIYLLFGVYTGRRHYAKIWCAAQSVHLLVSILITVYQFLYSKIPFLHQFLEFAITTGLDGYFILVVYSYYRENKLPPRVHV